MKVCIFEDDKVIDFFPLTMTRAVFELRCGRTLLIDKLLDFLSNPSEVCLSVRDYLAEVVKMRYPNYHVNEFEYLKGDEVLFVNGRWLYSGEDIKIVEDEVAVFSNGELVYLRAKPETVSEILAKGDIGKGVKEVAGKLGQEEVKEAKLVKWPWELVFANPEMIKYDFKRLGKKGVHAKVKHLEIVGGDENDVYIAPTAKIYPYVVIDVSGGPVIIEDGVKIQPFVFIEGPSAIGRDTYVMGRALIREGVTAGPVVRLGGEIEESIIHGYTNKYHTGFLGHAYVGEWVNLGAITTNSDLKNDYSEVEVYINGKPVKTGSLKVGSIIGDHTKTSIGTLLNTGTIIGVMCNVLSTDLSPKYIPSFTWYYAGRLSKGSGLRRMLRTAERAMARRNVKLTDAERRLFHYLYEMTREERENYIKRYSKRRV